MNYQDEINNPEHMVTTHKMHNEVIALVDRINAEIVAISNRVVDEEHNKRAAALTILGMLGAQFTCNAIQAFGKISDTGIDRVIEVINNMLAADGAGVTLLKMQ